jgi:hypothetical protein
MVNYGNIDRCSMKSVTTKFVMRYYARAKKKSIQSKKKCGVLKMTTTVDIVKQGREQRR